MTNTTDNKAKKILKLTEAAEQTPWSARRLRDFVSLTGDDPKKLHVSQPGTNYYVTQKELDRFIEVTWGV